MADVDLMTNPMTAAGDIVTGGAAGAPGRLALGSALQHLRVNAGATALEFADPPSAGAGGGPTVVRKTADESVTSSTTLQNDDELLLAIGANEVWEFEAVIWWESPSAADFTTAFTVPTGATLLWAAPNFTNAAGTGWLNSVIDASGTSRDWVSGGAGSPRILVCKGLVTNGATAGNLQFQWAQNSSNGTAAKVYANSTLKGYQLV